jgi:hypothetical protein
VHVALHDSPALRGHAHVLGGTASRNTVTTPATYTWKIDLTPPITVVTEKPPPLTNSTTATFAFSSPDQTATFLCSLNGAAAVPCKSPLTYPGLSDATRTLLIQAVDPAGNRDTQAQPIAWTVDTTPPDTTLANPGNVIRKDVVVFSFTSSEPGSAFKCSSDNGAFTACTSPFPMDVLAPGPHQFSVERSTLPETPIRPRRPTTGPAINRFQSGRRSRSSASRLRARLRRRSPSAIFGEPTASKASAPVAKRNPGLTLTFTNPLANLLSTPTFTLATKLHAQWSSDSSAVSYDVTSTTILEDSTGTDIHGRSTFTIKQYHGRSERRRC